MYGNSYKYMHTHQHDKPVSPFYGLFTTFQVVTYLNQFKAWRFYSDLSHGTALILKEIQLFLKVSNLGFQSIPIIINNPKVIEITYSLF